MCTTMLEEKTQCVFDIINSSNGITTEELIVELNRKYSGAFFFNAHVSLNDLIETNILVGRLRVDNNCIFITEKGEKYLSSIKEISGKCKRKLKVSKKELPYEQYSTDGFTFYI